MNPLIPSPGRPSAARAGLAVLALACAAMTGPARAAEPVEGPPAADEPLAVAGLALASMAPVAPFDRPLVLRSRADGGQASATLLALVERPFRDVGAALADAAHWCAALILHINNQGCSVAGQAPQAHLLLTIARRYDQPPEQASVFDFGYRVVAATTRELSVRLDAPAGPYGIRDSSIVFEAAPAGESRTAVRMSYAYRQGGLAGLAAAAYFATAGRDKVGFSAAPAGDGGHEGPVGGVRGLLERNLMRYFLAVEAAAATPQVSDAGGYLRRLHDWFAATERYPRQLHEVDLDTYLALKRPLQDVGVPPAAAAPH